MRQQRHRQAGFTLLEILMAMGLFVIAAVGLAQALNIISLTVNESIDAADVREQLRGVLVKTSRDPNIEAGSRTLRLENGIIFEIEVIELSLQNREGFDLNDIYEVKVSAFRELPGRKSELISTADTWVFGELF